MPGIIAQAPAPPVLRSGTHWCLVLAAGGSRRLGRPKQIVPLAGTTLVELACRRAFGTRPAGVVVVVGAHASRVCPRLARLPVTIVRNRDWRGGLAGSLRAGLARVPPYVPAVLVTTVDQWRITVSDLRRVVAAGAPAAAAYRNACGVPALLPRHWRRQVRELRGDGGARALLRAAEVRRVPIPDAAFDLDTPADLAILQRARRAGRAPG